jgi:hypothetical protein
MRRAGPSLVLMTLMGLMVNAVATMPAHADCAADLKALRAKLATIKDPRRRDELQKLIEKAEKDNEAGRAELCGEDVQRAQTLVKG